MLVVATVPTACGIETKAILSGQAIRQLFVATVPTACGIETFNDYSIKEINGKVATVPTACGIETVLLLN